MAETNGIASVNDAFRSVVYDDMPSFLRLGQEEKQIQIPRKWHGLCATGDGTKWAAEWSRFSTGAFNLPIAAGPSVTLKAEQLVSLMTAGPGEQGATGLPYNSTDSDTDLADTGAPVDLDQKYVIFALAFKLLRPYVFTAAAGATPAFLRYTQWLDDLTPTLKEIFLEQCNVQFRWKDNACDAVGGPLTNWPAAGGPQGGNVVANGQQMGVGNLIPLRRPMLAGAQNTLSKVQLDVRNGIGLQVDVDPANPPLAGEESIYVPVQVAIYGAAYDACSPACVPDFASMPAEVRKAWEQFISAITSKA